MIMTKNHLLKITTKSYMLCFHRILVLQSIPWFFRISWYLTKIIYQHQKSQHIEYEIRSHLRCKILRKAEMKFIRLSLVEYLCQIEISNGQSIKNEYRKVRTRFLKVRVYRSMIRWVWHHDESKNEIQLCIPHTYLAESNYLLKNNCRFLLNSSKDCLYAYSDHHICGHRISVSHASVDCVCLIIFS